jgi:hypothetical protein
MPVPTETDEMETFWGSGQFFFEKKIDGGDPKVKKRCVARAQAVQGVVA